MVLECCTKIEVAQKRCPIVFQGHLSRFRVTQGEKLLVWRRLFLAFRFGNSNLSSWMATNLDKNTGPVAVIKSLGLALFVK